MGGPPFSNRNSVGAQAARANPAWNFSPSVSSCQRVHVTNLNSDSETHNVTTKTEVVDA